MESFTLFPETAIEVGQQVREAILDHDAFEQRVKPCELASCKATCCYDGVYLGSEEVEMVKVLVEREAEKGTWDRYGLEAKDGSPLSVGNILTTSETGRDKTSVRKAKTGELAEAFPTHFNQTRCIFLDSLGRCGFQRLAMEEGVHPWFYKPLTCWIHPLALDPPETRGSRAKLTLYNDQTDPHVEKDYPGFCSHTPCGKVNQNGIPAKESLKEELIYLSKISERDLLTELDAPQV